MTDASNSFPNFPTGQPAETGTPGNRRHDILVVEDDDHIRSALVTFLRRCAYVVHEAIDGREAQLFLADHKVDVIITDISMPRGDGIELLLQVRKIPNPPRVIAISGGLPCGLKAAQQIGAWRTLAKPFALEQLLATLQNAVA